MSNTKLNNITKLNNFSVLTEDEMLIVEGAAIPWFVGFLTYEIYANSDQIIAGFKKGFNATRK